MPAFFAQWPHSLQALAATLFTWGITAAGAATVFLVRRPGGALMNDMLGFSAGIMLAASYWSLLEPAVELAEKLQMNAWLPVTAGLAAGGILLYIGDRLYLYRSTKNTDRNIEKRNAMLMLSITLHNIPEGLAVGVAFGALAYRRDGAALTAALLLALGIGLQNFPEGAAVSWPLMQGRCTKKRAFLMGMLSGIVEPAAGIAGALLAARVQLLLPYLLSFAAGAMIYAVAEELIPESQRGGRPERVTLFTLAGFAVMTALDIALG